MNFQKLKFYIFMVKLDVDLYRWLSLAVIKWQKCTQSYVCMQEHNSRIALEMFYLVRRSSRILPPPTYHLI